MLIFEQSNGYLGPFGCILEKWQTQSQIFLPNDRVTFWMSQMKTENSRHDWLIFDWTMLPTKTSRNRCQEGGGGCQQPRKNKRGTNNSLKNKQIQATRQFQKKKGGWEGKAKGLLQVLWEQGWINPNNVDKHKLTGKSKEYK